MRIIVCSLFSIVVIFADPIGRRSDNNLSRLETKIIKGYPAFSIYHDFVASLQVNNVHICSAGCFQPQFLITTARCVHYINKRMIEHLEPATALLGSTSYDELQSFNILFLLHHPNFTHTSLEKSFNFDIGIVMLDMQLSKWTFNTIPLYKGTFHKYNSGNPIICGWGSTTIDEQEISIGKTTNNADMLNCMAVLLGSEKCCSTYNTGDFKNFQMCGQGKDYTQKIVSADVGSPMVAAVGRHQYIIGVTSDRGNDAMRFVRFVRTGSVYQDITDITTELIKLAEKIENQRLNFETSVHEQHKNPKIQQ